MPSRPDTRSVGAVGVTLVLIGIALVVLAVESLQWYRVDAGVDVAGSGFTFRDLQQNANQLNAPVASAYFNWLALSLGLGGMVIGVLANVPSAAANALRLLGFLVGVAGVVGTYYALDQLFYAQRAAGGGGHGVFHNATYGVWCAFAGFLVAAFGAAVGPRRT